MILQIQLCFLQRFQIAPFYYFILFNLIVIMIMSVNDHLQSRIELLNNYTLCLQRQNESKSKQNDTLYKHLELMTRQNENLRATISELRLQMMQKQENQTICQSFVVEHVVLEKPPILIQSDSMCQTDEKEEEEMRQSQHLKLKVEALKEVIKQKDQKILGYQQECEEMYDGIVKLEKCLAQQEEQHQKDLDTIKILEQKLKVEQRKRTMAEKRFQEVNQTIQSVDEENEAVREHIYSLQTQITDLVSANNRLIQRVRQLEKEKNEYYHQLKKCSRISFGTQHLGNSAMKKGPKVRDQRWKQIETNLKKLQQQNEAIQANLHIK